MKLLPRLGCRVGALLVFASSSLSAAAPVPVVVANGEKLHGTCVGGIAEFRGIPFARPPVGELRWHAPEDPVPRTGPQAANRFAPACMQGSGAVDWYVGVARAFGHGPEVVARPSGVSEDCLYLNVWSPSPERAAGLPVMVFVHGGSNSGGWSYEPNYLGRRLAARGVVVVTIAYRVGPFGFFSHPALNNEAGEPVANFGLLDIRQGFRWVHEHIRAFGGDPDRITAFGESAGAFDLVDLLVAELGRGRGRKSLFRRTISQSLGGSLVERQTLVEEQATGELLVGKLGLGPSVTAARLREIAAEDLLAAARELPAGHSFDAVIDGQTLIARPLDALRGARATGVDFMIGTNADEWYMYFDENLTRADLESWLDEKAAGHRDSLLAEVSDDTDLRRTMDRWSTARTMLCPSRFLARRISEGGGRAWVYYFTRQRPGLGGEELGVYHGTELPYVFGTHDDWLPTDERDRELTEVVMDYWVQFAKTGDPNLPGRAKWPPHSARTPGVMELGNRVGAMEPFSVDLCNLLGPASPTT